MSATLETVTATPVRMAGRIRHVVVTFVRALDGHLALEERIFVPSESAAIAAARRFASRTAAAVALRQTGTEVEVLCHCGTTPAVVAAACG